MSSSKYSIPQCIAAQIELTVEEAAGISFAILPVTFFRSFAHKNKAGRIEIPECLLKPSTVFSSKIEAAMLVLSRKKSTN